MDHDDGMAIVVVSDLHLAAGLDPETGRVARFESFVHDPAFARFVDDLRSRALAERRRWRLVMLGDVLDFLRVSGDVAQGAPAAVKARLDTSDRAALAKLERVAAGHRPLFAALGRFVAAGSQLDVVPGNHDIELVRQSLQARFKELVAGRPEAAAAIRFYPWILYVPGVLYAEHGHQYHDINAFATLLRPHPTRYPDEIALPLGSQLEAYRLGLVESIDPAADVMSPPSLLRAVRARPIPALRTLPDQARLLKMILGELGQLSRPARAAERLTYHEQVLRPYAAEIGLDYDTLVAIDRLSMVTAGSLTSRLGRTLVVQPALRPLRRRSTPPKSSYLLVAARAIHGLLHAKGQDVPFYVFGHTHRADRVPLTASAAAPWYLNPGSWTAPEPGIAGGPGRFTFVEITRAPEASAPVARLLRWNDAAGRSEPFSPASP